MLRRFAFLCFLASLAIGLALSMPAADWRAVPAVLAGWYIADLLSGAAHMYLDYRPCAVGMGIDRLYFYDGPRDGAEYLALKAQVFGRISPLERLVFDFKTHHPRPDALGHRTALYLATSPALIVALPAAVLLDVALWFGWVPGWMGIGLVALLFGGALSQYFHGSLHVEDPPWFVVAARRLKLLMTPRAHALHHATLNRDFGTTSGWANPLLNFVFNALRRRGMMPDSGLEPTG